MNSFMNKENNPINRRIFLKRGAYAGIGLFTAPLIGCSKNDEPGEPATPDPEKPDHPPITPGAGIDLYGSIIDTDGQPVEGVVVSDGFSCTVTDNEGVYRMKRDSRATHVFYSTPAGYEVNTTNDHVKTASFYAALSPASKRYNFTLKKLPQIEKAFSFVCIGDPQVANASDVERFKTETLPDIKAFIDASETPCYGLVLGDVTADQPPYLSQMKTLLGSMAMPVFVTIGNHDKTGGTASAPRTGTTFSEVFGPLNYSFNRGDVHFVCLDNILFTNNADYAGGFTEEQVAWLKQDLSYVPTHKLILVYYHIPIRNTAGMQNRENLLTLLSKFENVHLMCGHTHYSENCFISSPINTFEHIHAAACGSWWKSTVNGDGTPNGYAVYSINGNTFADWYYKPVRYDRDFQIRLHWGDAEFGGPHGTYKYGQAGDTVYANVWNADKNWKVEAFEDGVKVADLTKLSDSTKDAWSLGYHIGVLNRNPQNYSPNCKHAYVHKKIHPDAALEIRATDPFGHVYTQREITTSMDTAAAY
jgi:hypothetical protein